MFCVFYIRRPSPSVFRIIKTTDINLSLCGMFDMLNFYIKNYKNKLYLVYMSRIIEDIKLEIQCWMHVIKV